MIFEPPTTLKLLVNVMTGVVITRTEPFTHNWLKSQDNPEPGVDGLITGYVFVDEPVLNGAVPGM